MFLCFLLALAIEILIKINNATVVSYSKRNWFYYIFSITFAVTFSLCGIFLQDFGGNGLNRCLIKDELVKGIYYGCSITVVFIIWGILIYSWRKVRKETHKKKFASLFYNYFVVVITVSSSLAITYGVDLIEDNNTNRQEVLKDIGVMLGCISGCCVSLARLCNKKLLKAIYLKIFFVKNRATEFTSETLLPERITSNDILFFGDFFESITKRVIVY